MHAKILKIFQKEKKRRFQLLCILCLLIILQSCWTQEQCFISGSWTIKRGRLSERYEGTAPYHSNRVKFHNDTVDLASGFFYNTIGINDDYPKGRYPFVYYGNKEIYRTEADELQIFSRPYNKWTSFKIKCIAKDRVMLINQENVDTVVLEKSNKPVLNSTCKIKSIGVHVHKGTLDQFNVGYKATFSQNDVMVYEQQDSVGDTFTRRTFNLRKGTFENICSGFSYVNLSALKPVYPATVSDFKTAEILIQMIDGKEIKSRIQNIAASDAPDELRLALVPVLYLHQEFVYPKFRAKRFNDD